MDKRMKRVVTLPLAFTLLMLTSSAAAEKPHTVGLAPLVRVVDMNVGDAREVELCDGSKASVQLLKLEETHDTVREAVRRAEVTVEVNGNPVTLVSATYHLPTTVGNVQIDCSITGG